MPKCPACDKDVQDGWKYCPACGMELGTDLETIEYDIDKLKYLWERNEKGKFVYSNFQTVKDMGVLPYKEVKGIREELSDFAHIYLLNMHEFSFLFLSPNFLPDFYKVGKLLGYYTADISLKTTKLDIVLNTLRRTGLFWKGFEDTRIQEVYENGWEKLRAGCTKVAEIDKKNKRVRYTLIENFSSLTTSSKPSCFMEPAIIAGHAEALFSSLWDGVETKCKCTGADHCEVEVYLHEQEIQPPVQVFSKKELDSIVNQFIEKIVNRTKTNRTKLGDYAHISASQVINYFLVSLSPGHAVISKYAGRICGERIAEKAQLQGQDAALTYLEDMFLYLKAGILHSEKAGDRVIIRMKESVYASGVSNIHQNLCIFLAGIIEGALNKATGQKWDVSEMKCLASGFPECEFWCKKL
jgi:predicted hydrocarbon binding protein